MTTVLRASGSADFLGIVPALAGFTPRESIVLIPFQGSRAYGAMRLDVPRDADPDDYAASAIALVSRVAATDAVAVVVYTDDPAQRTRDGLVLPHAVAVDALVDEAEEAGLRIVDALCVLSDGWSSYLDDDPELASLSEISPSEEAAALGDVSGDQFDGTALPRADLAEKERVGAALRDLTLALEHEASGHLTGAENPQALAAAVLLDDLPGFFEMLLETPGNLPPFAAAALLWCFERPVFRDVALTQWATDEATGRRILDAQLAFSRQGTRIPDDLVSVFLGRGRRPDPDRLHAALDVVRAAAARAPRTARRGPLTAAAWLSWALGRSTHASHYLDLVREIDPEYGLAALLGTMLGAAMLPEWSFRRGPDATAA